MPLEGLEPKAQEAWAKSVYVWDAWYGSYDNRMSHIAYLGLVPLDFISKTGYWWFQLETEGVTRGMLRDAKEVFAILEERLGWTTYAHTEVKNKKATRFAEFFQFHIIKTLDGQHYHKRTE